MDAQNAFNLLNREFALQYEGIFSMTSRRHLTVRKRFDYREKLSTCQLIMNETD